MDRCMASACLYACVSRTSTQRSPAESRAEQSDQGHTSLMDGSMDGLMDGEHQQEIASLTAIDIYETKVSSERNAEQGGARLWR